MNKEWYKTSFRRNLVDMHIEDWSDEFLSQFSPEDYCANLIRAHIKSAMIYFQSHNGLCYFPTKVGVVHRAFQGASADKMKRLVDLCHQNGIDVIGYYSLIYNTAEEDRHPEWALLRDDGTSPRRTGGRYGHCCPNAREYVDFCKAQIKEILEYFEVDGMFYDMLFWPDFCACDKCKARWKAETGLDKLPNIKTREKNWQLHYEKRCDWMAEFAQEITNYTQSLVPGISVEHNCANTIANTYTTNEAVINACTYAGGDLYGDIYRHTFAQKFYYSMTKNQPFEYMVSRCEPSLQQHTTTKSQAKLDRETMLCVAHHAANFVIDAIDPVGTLDSRVYERIGKAFEKQIPYEKYFNGKMINELGIMLVCRSKYSGYGNSFLHQECTENAYQTAAESHLSVGIFSSGRPDLIDRHKALSISNAEIIPSAAVDAVEKFVHNGGNLYFSGGNKELLSRFFGATVKGWTEHTFTYIAPTEKYQRLFFESTEKYPLTFQCPLPIVEMPHGVEVGAFVTTPYTKQNEQKFASIHSNPPGIKTDYPAFAITEYGKGTVVWSLAPIEADRRYMYTQIYKNILEILIPSKTRIIRANAPKRIETVSFWQEDAIQVSAIDLLYDEEQPVMNEFALEVKCNKKPSKIVLLPDEKISLPFEYENECARFTVPSFELFASILIKL